MSTGGGLESRIKAACDAFLMMRRPLVGLSCVNGRSCFPARQFVFSRGGDCFLYDIAQRKEKLLFSVAPNKIYATDVSRPGRIYFTQTVCKGDIWLGRMDQENN
jgi:hypothetical protein